MPGVILPSALAAAAVGVLFAPRPGALRTRSLSHNGTGRSGSSERATAGGRRTWTGRGHSAARLPRRVAEVGGAVLLLLGLARVAGVLPALLTLGAAAAGLSWHRRRSLASGRARERSRALEACSALASELRAGRSPAQALAVAAQLACGPSGEALSAAAAAARFGGDVGTALCPPAGQDRPAGRRTTGRRVARREREQPTAVPEVLRALAACWTVCASSGSGLAPAVSRLEEGLRADETQRHAVQAELAGPRATAGMLAVLPLAGLGLSASLGADPVGVLLHTPAGRMCLVGGLAFDALGVLWTARLVARAGGTG